MVREDVAVDRWYIPWSQGILLYLRSGLASMGVWALYHLYQAEFIFPPRCAGSAEGQGFTVWGFALKVPIWENRPVKDFGDRSIFYGDFFIMAGIGTRVNNYINVECLT